MRFLLFCLFFSASLSAFAQKEKPTPLTDIEILEDTLAVLSFAMVNDSTPVKRYASCQKFIKTLVQSLKHENSFDYPFERVKAVSIQYAPDSTFRIFSWQLYVDINEYHYYGTIQMNQPELKLYPLVDRSEEVEDPYMDILENKNWYGNLIYNIKSFDTDEGKRYLLFGFDGYRFFTKRKIIDVLAFNDDKAILGAPIFEAEDSTIVNRFVLEYGADARVKMNWHEELDMPVFDHLVEMASPYKGQGNMYIPDGDLDGLKYEDGIWKYQRRVYDTIIDEAPRPEPVLNATERKDRIDLFGN